MNSCWFTFGVQSHDHKLWLSLQSMVVGTLHLSFFPFNFCMHISKNSFPWLDDRCTIVGASHLRNIWETLLWFFLQVPSMTMVRSYSHRNSCLRAFLQYSILHFFVTCLTWKYLKIHHIFMNIPLTDLSAIISCYINTLNLGRLHVLKQPK